MQICGEIQVAAGPGVCIVEIGAICTSQTVQSCGVLQVAAEPGVWLPFAQGFAHIEQGKG